MTIYVPREEADQDVQGEEDRGQDDPHGVEGVLVLVLRGLKGVLVRGAKVLGKGGLRFW